MKSTLLTIIALLTAAPIAALHAADEKKPPVKKPEAKKPGPKKPAPPRTDMVDEESIKLLKPYDKNTDHQIDIDEFESLAAEFKKNPKGPLHVFDKGKDGELDALMDRAGINVKLGAAATPATPKPPVKKPVPKKPAPKTPAAKPKPTA